jgi:5-methylcytosine-specific restriction endonuclease McrA
MIDMDQYKTRIATLYKNDRDRWRKVLSKGLPKTVKIDIPADKVLPYTQREFGQWLWSQIQLNAVLCPYCRAAIDVLSMELDHKTPLRRGGDMAFTNRECICRRCNTAKGQFTADEFRLLVVFMEGPGAHLRARLEGLLISGGQGQMMRHFPKQKKGDAKPKHTQEALYFDELGTF